MIQSATAGWLPRGASNALTWKVILDPEDDPLFAADRNILLATKRFRIIDRW